MRITAFLSVLLIFSAGLWVFLKPHTVPDVTLNFSTGQSGMLSDYTEEPILVTFWSIHCPPCLQDIPQLTELHHQGVMILAVAIPQDPPQFVIDLSNKRNIPYPIVLDVHGEVSKAFGGVQVTPTHFLLNHKRQILLHTKGPIDVKHIQQVSIAHNAPMLKK